MGCKTHPPELFTSCTISSPAWLRRCRRFKPFRGLESFCRLQSYLSFSKQFPAPRRWVWLKGAPRFLFAPIVPLIAQLANIIPMIWYILPQMQQSFIFPRFPQPCPPSHRRSSPSRHCVKTGGVEAHPKRHVTENRWAFGNIARRRSEVEHLMDRDESAAGGGAALPLLTQTAAFLSIFLDTSASGGPPEFLDR